MRFSLFCSLIFCRIRIDGPICLSECRSSRPNETLRRIAQTGKIKAKCIYTNIFTPYCLLAKAIFISFLLQLFQNSLRYEMDSFTVFFKKVFTSHVIIWCIFLLKCPCLLFHQTAKVELDIVLYNLSSHFNKTICQTFVKANICKASSLKSK